MSENTLRRIVSTLSMMILLLSLGVTLVQAKTVLTIAGHPYTRTSIEKFAAEYTALHPDVEFQFVLVETGSPVGLSKLTTMSAGDAMPDIIHGSPELLTAGFMQPMPQKLASDVAKFFMPLLLPGLSLNGHLFGIPTENHIFALGRNQRMFDEAGVVGVPNNWAELRTAARKLTKVDGDGRVVIHGFSIQGQFARFTQSFINMLWSNGGEYIDQTGKVRLNERPVIETVEYLADIFASGQFSFANTIRNAKSAMSVTPTFWRTQVQEQAPGELQYIRTSIFPNNNGPKVAYQYGWGLFVTHQSRNSTAAWDFLRWLTMEKGANGFTRLSESLFEIGSMPSNRLDLGRKEYVTDPYFEGFVAGLDILRAEPTLPELFQRQTALYKTLRPAIEGQVSVLQAVADAHQQISNLLAIKDKK